MASSPAGKRKRAGPVDSALGEIFIDTTPRKKRARFHLDHDDLENFSDADSYAGSYTPYADSVDAAATDSMNDSETPITEASSTRSKSRPREKKFMCTWPSCDKKFSRPVQLQAHMNSHTGERPFKCDEDDCSQSFFKRDHLRRHVKDKHGNQSFTCAYVVFNDVKGQQEACNRTFASQAKLKRHMAAHEDKEETTCSWPHCRKVFRKQDTLQRHIKADHLGEDAYTCTRKTPDGSSCRETFPTPSQLKSHERKEHEPPKYICDICASDDEPPLDDVIPNDLDEEFLPGPEDMVAPKEEPTNGSMGALSLDEVPTAPPSFGPGRFLTLHELQRHNRLFHPPTCSDCGKVCKSKKDLAAHMDILHSAHSSGTPHVAQKRFVCPYVGCDRSTLENGFTKKGNMQQHVKTAHTKEKKYICGEYDLGGVEKLTGWNRIGCGRVMGTKQSLIGHIRTQHMGLPALVSKRTGRIDKVNKHDLLQNPTTEGATTTACEDADQDVNMQDEFEPDRTLSMITGYGYEQIRPFACLERARGCQARFTKVYELSYHMEMTHDWNVDDINEAVENPDTFAPESAGDEDNVLRQMLRTELDGPLKGVVDPQLDTMQI
ncbi:hypothetical protein CKM354_000339200 [Cercospora kikuchii]|uniref:C2H2-type domain-containing protein n=1 Tax=Cercospora kikuchii TaxID=84275 RepID=A0A9P3FDN8_9PEZI|nr:uncharacterized protein CKM354_000339200 [Cercospora kikuchii]GIZ40037.1 hypothetical protein CKM354_000339200 [Cercospora kikuchii]